MVCLLTLYLRALQAEFEARQQAISQLEAAPKKAQPRTASKDAPDPTTALTKAINDADAARKQRSLKPGSPETQQVCMVWEILYPYARNLPSGSLQSSYKDFNGNYLIAWGSFELFS